MPRGKFGGGKEEEGEGSTCCGSNAALKNARNYQASFPMKKRTISSFVVPHFVRFPINANKSSTFIVVIIAFSNKLWPAKDSFSNFRRASNHYTFTSLLLFPLTHITLIALSQLLSLLLVLFCHVFRLIKSKSFCFDALFGPKHPLPDFD